MQKQGIFKFVSLLFFSLAIFIAISGCDRNKHAETVNMVLIPAGEFIMGSDKSPLSNADQQPLHHVYLDAYYIDKYEVTNQQYEEFILDSGYQQKRFWTREGWEFIQKNKIDKPLSIGRKLFNRPKQPVTGVSWYEAEAYCRWAGKRLPTEAEWEKAARGIDGRKYPWGNQMDFTRISYRIGGGIRTLEVGSFPAGASPYGVMDMAGNVWEWVSDWYDETYYAKSPKKNPKGPTDGKFRCLRGGSWGSNRVHWQCTYRYYDKPDYRNFNIGFRCALDAQ